ncbi:hypothetical protein TZ00_02725 [Agreia bicolorata]|uniref:UspA domain-containing protein n=1 Tax=Agreia bicolorata TaxID=110935 RepID=A0ABR5CJV4_9MICO|nr:hypothetical protein TZ00_02725 [Agreia bicolorata]
MSHAHPPADAEPIVVGHDGSSGADRALRKAFDLARALTSPITVVRTWSIDSAPAGSLFHDGYVTSFSEVSERTRDLVTNETKPLCDEYPDVPTRFVGMLGQPAEVLVNLSSSARMLVVGSRGRGGFAALMLGSVSEQCVRHALCPVLVVPPSTRTRP